MLGEKKVEDVPTKCDVLRGRMLTCERLASKISSYADYFDVINPDPLEMDVITDAIRWVQVRADLPR